MRFKKKKKKGLAACVRGQPCGIEQSIMIENARLVEFLFENHQNLFATEKLDDEKSSVIRPAVRTSHRKKTRDDEDHAADIAHAAHGSLHMAQLGFCAVVAC